MTKGVRTSEFYLAVLTVGLAFYLSLTGADAGSIAAMTGPAGIYIGGRAYAKKGQ